MSGMAAGLKKLLPLRFKQLLWRLRALPPYLLEKFWGMPKQFLRYCFRNSPMDWPPDCCRACLPKLSWSALLWGSWRILIFSPEETYCASDVDIVFDDSCSLPYVLFEGRRLYFPKNMDHQAIADLFITLLYEQQSRSPHRYEGGQVQVKEGDVLADVGAAEGIFALKHIDKLSHAYLFECQQEWLEALRATFAPWADKVTLIDRCVGDSDTAGEVRLDTYFASWLAEESGPPMFLKADIEGSESSMLQGAGQLLACRRLERLAICTYHRKRAEAEFRPWLYNLGFHSLESSENAMICAEPGHFCFVHGILRASR